MITEEHLRPALAAVGSAEVELAREAMAHGKVLLKLIGKGFRKELSPLSTEAKWAVAGLKRS